jgi:hypothetical protein
VTWLSLSKATVILDHDEHKARERLSRAISKAWQTPPGGLPQSTEDPNIPLRIQVSAPPGQRIEGRAWLEHPALDWESSEIECSCRPWAPVQASQSAPAGQCRAKILVWEEDLVRLWGGAQTFDSPIP